MIHRGNNRGSIFFDPSDRGVYAELLKAACLEHGVAIHAYVLMDNHVHFLASPAQVDSLPFAMRETALAYAKHVNRTWERTGSLWEGRYRASLIDSDRYLFTCMRYIELNPVRAEMVSEPRDFRWSSHRANGYGDDDPLVTPHPLLRDLGASWAERRAGYRAMFRDGLSDASVKAVRAATQYGWPLGSDAFVAAVGRAHGVPSRPRRKHSP